MAVMATAPFDTLDFSRRLREGDFSAQQAETMADALKVVEIVGRDPGRGLIDCEELFRGFGRPVLRKVGTMLVVTNILFFAAMKLFS